MRPDVLLLTEIDWDHGLVALSAFAAMLEAAGHPMPHRFAARPNRGMATGLDLDGDGRRGTPDDAQGWGRFAGAGGMAVLSRLPIATGEVRDFSAFLWRDLPGALLAGPDGAGAMPPEVLAVQRLATTAAWDVPVRLPGGGRLHLLAFHAGPPAFGAPGGRNLRRNHDEVTFWRLLLEGRLPMPPPAGPFVLLGNANLDPADGAGLHGAIAALLAHPGLQDPRPASAGGLAAATGRSATHAGDPALDTVLWDGPRQPGNLRVAYVLPAAGLRVLAAGVLWPLPGEPLAAAVAAASPHRLVWVDLAP